MKDFPYLNILQNWQKSIGQIISWEMAHHKQTVFMITTNIGQKFVFKKIIHMPNLARLTSEYNVLHYLHKHGVPVSVPLLTDDGAFYTQVYGEIFILSPALSTTDSGAESTDRQKYYIIGKALGQFHRALATYPGNIDSWTMNLPQKLEHEILPNIEQNLELEMFSYINELITPIKQDIYLQWEQLPTQYIHGDCHGGNLLFNGQEVTGFIDLAHLPVGARVYDLSYFLADEIKTRIDNRGKLTQWLGSFEYLFWGNANEMPLTALEINTAWYGMLFTQLMFIDWFTTHNDKDQIAKNLAVFNWIYTQRHNIDTSLTRIHISNQE